MLNIISVDHLPHMPILGSSNSPANNGRPEQADIKREREKKGRSEKKNGWLVVFGFNGTLKARVISWRWVTHMYCLGFSHQHLHNFSFQSHRLLFSQASAEVRGENKPERKLASTGDRTHNHQVMSPTCSPLSHQGGAQQQIKI